MKNRIWIGMTIVLFLIGLTGCSSFSETTGSLQKDDSQPDQPTRDFQKIIKQNRVPENQWPLLPEGLRRIQKRGKLLVAMYQGERSPYFYVNDKGNLVGSDVEMARDIAANMGVKVKFIRTADTFEEVVNQVATGKADIAVSKLSTTLLRSQKVLFTDPYLKLHKALLLNRLKLAQLHLPKDHLLESLKDLDVRISVRAGTSYIGYAQTLFPKADIIRDKSSDPESIMERVYDGKVLAAFYDEFAVKSYLNKKPNRSLKLQMHILRDNLDYLGIAVNSQNMALRNWLNTYLQLKKPYVNEVLEKYGLKEVPND